jgi:hypothetical protein
MKLKEEDARVPWQQPAELVLKEQNEDYGKG